MKNLIYRNGSAAGQAHLRKRKNNQDAFAIGETIVNEKEYLFGVVSDGCTGRAGSRTEVGSILVTRFIRSEIPLILAAGISIEELPAALFPRCIGFFRSIAGTTVIGNPEIIWDFISKHLLCTIIGFVMNDEKLLIFTAGDGTFIVNREITVIDQNNTPYYPAYHLVDRKILGSTAQLLPQSFEICTFPAETVKKLAICTDGINDELENDGLIEGIWCYEPEAKGGLQWWLNIQSGEGRFRDDCTIVAVKRIG